MLICTDLFFLLIILTVCGAFPLLFVVTDKSKKMKILPITFLKHQSSFLSVSSWSHHEPSHPINGGTMDSALCIVPPDDAWDVIQRARHSARDATFYTWPPCIRLFHPFVPRQNLTDTATDIAQLIQQMNISSFDITLDQLLILPHFELVEQEEDRMASLP
jgi:hypothetical protein